MLHLNCKNIRKDLLLQILKFIKLKHARSLQSNLIKSRSLRTSLDQIHNN